MNSSFAFDVQEFTISISLKSKVMIEVGKFSEHSFHTCEDTSKTNLFQKALIRN